MNEQDFIRAAREHYIREAEDAAELWDWIKTSTQPDEASEEAYYFPDGYFDTINWMECNCLDTDSHEILLSTGGPATGIVLIQNHPYFWYQDWWKEKYTEPLRGDAAEFYYHIFDWLKELV